MGLSSSTSKTRRTSERTSSFVCDLPLRVGWVLGRRLAAKLEVARQVYNACLGEALRRLGLVRQSVWFTKAKATPRERKQARQAHFRAARDAHEFSDAAVQRYGIRLRSKDRTGSGGEGAGCRGLDAGSRSCGAARGDLGYEAPGWRQAERPQPRSGGRRPGVGGAWMEESRRRAERGTTLRCARAEKTWIGEHLGAHEVQALASRAYRATNEHLLGERGRPRFKGKGRVHSVEGKGPGSGLCWRGDHLVWGDLDLKPVIDPDDPAVRHALCSRVKYARIVRRRVRGRTRWYVQLVCEGRPYRKPKDRLGSGTVGLDLGPSTLAAVSAKEALLVPFCPEVEQPAKAIRRLQRHIDRQRRAGNPGNYLRDGRVRPCSRWRRCRTVPSSVASDARWAGGRRGCSWSD